MCMDESKCRNDFFNSFNIGLKMGKHIQNQPIVKNLEMLTKPEIDYKNMKSIYSTFVPLF